MSNISTHLNNSSFLTNNINYSSLSYNCPEILTATTTNNLSFNSPACDNNLTSKDLWKNHSEVSTQSSSGYHSKNNITNNLSCFGGSIGGGNSINSFNINIDYCCSSGGAGGNLTANSGGNKSTPRIITKSNKIEADCRMNGGDIKKFSNGDDFMDFSNFSPREGNFYSIPSQNSQDLNNISSFPPIGTFSVETSSNQSSIFNSNEIGSRSSNSSRNNVFNNSPRQTGQNSSGANSASYNGNNSSSDNQGTRETGIIEKLLHSYGFIQCCERQARLFFHFSQFSGNIEHLKIGDPVEFEMTYDRRTGKPIASQVTKIAPEVVLSEERVTGTVTTEIKCETSSSSGENTGRISYENRGECFFLPYTKDDVEGNVSLRSGDKVSFQIATNQRGNLGACHIRLENPAHPVKYRGVVCSMKDSFGFIERSDVVKEIFFHFSEADENIELRPGDDVEFTIQTRTNDLQVKSNEVACNIVRLEPGSVIFEDVGTTIMKGQVLKPLDRNNPQRHNTDPLPGRIRYRAQDHSEVEVPFGDKDQKGDFTLRHGDWVQFLLATDRRDQLQRATLISLLEETFDVSGEKREQGIIAALKDGFGFLRCVERNTRIFFHFTEVLDTVREIYVGDEVEFTVIQDPTSSFSNTRFSAIRIKHLTAGTVQFETLVKSDVEGVISREAPKSPIKSLDRTEGGVITYTESNTKKTIMYFLKDCEKSPRVGDIVKFNIFQVKRNKELIAINVQEIQNTIPSSNHNDNNLQNTFSSPHQRTMGGGAKYANNSNDLNNVYQGFIAVLKEHFGFIETVDHKEEVFFHFSNFAGNLSSVELGQEVEYTLSSRSNITSCGNCLPAENVRFLARGTISQPMVYDTVYTGTVVRPLRCVNPDQVEYSGLVRTGDANDDSGSVFEFGITSLINKRDLLQKNDNVSFKLDEDGRAREIKAMRAKTRANVDSIKGQFGFLDYEIDEGKKLFFHMSEVQGNGNNLHSGDTVEFSIVTNQRSGKSSACNVAKVIDNCQRL